MDSENVPSSNVLNSEGVDALCKQVLTCVMKTVRSSSGLPQQQDDYDLYNTFPGFRNFVKEHSTELLKTMNKCLNYEGLNKIPDVAEHSSISIDEKMDKVIESNDMLLEQVSMLIDEEKKLLKNKSDHGKQETFKPLPVQKPETVISSWNKKSKNGGSSQTFKLFHAHNIVRPQLKFKDKIDNSSVPFVPKLKSKPNALKDLPKALVDLRMEDDINETSLIIANLVRQGRNYSQENSSIYDHPYQYEIEHFIPEASQLQRKEPEKYTDFPKVPCEVVSDKEELMQIVKELENCKEIAVDLEHHSYRSFQGIACLIQISTRKNDYLIDALALRSELEVLNNVFTNPNIVKVFHGADSDVLWLQRDFGVYVVNLFDTGQASREMSMARNSFDFLLKTYIGLKANKKYQLADWRIRPLPVEMRKYAQEDTHYLLYIYDVMKNELLDLGEKEKIGEKRLLNVIERSKHVCLNKYEKNLFRDDAYLQFYQRHKKKNLNPTQIELLRLLYNWRDSVAREDDESTGYVLPNHMMFQIADILPREAHGILACCNPVPPLVRQNVQSLHQMVIEARLKSHDKKYVKPMQKTTTQVLLDHVNYEDILTCQHDLSHYNHENLNINHSLNKDDVKPVKTLSETAFFPVTKNNKVKKINENLPDPFYKFMPFCERPTTTVSSSANSENCNLTYRDFLQPNFVWKLKAPPKPKGNSKPDQQPKLNQTSAAKTEKEIVLKKSKHKQNNEVKKEPTEKRVKFGKTDNVPNEQFKSYDYQNNYSRFNQPTKKKNKHKRFKN